VVYKISPKGRYKVLHAFDGADGNSPSGTPLLDKDGNIFGTTQQGGQNGFGTIYELTPHGTEKVLYSFTRADGISPYPGVVRDDEGNLYGTTQGGGANNYGTLFKFSPAGALTVLHAFGPGPGDGWGCYGAPTIIKNAKGKTELYSVCSYGGTDNYGTAYKLSADGQYKILYNFTAGSSDAMYPQGLLAAGPGGKFYGASNQGGGDGCIGNGCGTVFELH
jgi:uncharacterized repeat protein (TIGR03803 family)